jgi:hypothetical protein
MSSFEKNRKEGFDEFWGTIQSSLNRNRATTPLELAAASGGYGQSPEEGQKPPKQLAYAVEISDLLLLRHASFIRALKFFLWLAKFYASSAQRPVFFSGGGGGGVVNVK